MAKRKPKKLCERGGDKCYWQFGDWCLRFPGHSEAKEGRMPAFRIQSKVSMEECKTVCIVLEHNFGSRWNPLRVRAEFLSKVGE